MPATGVVQVVVAGAAVYVVIAASAGAKGRVLRL
jgi:hypothetical protein